jgi:hypothetical protein
MAHVVKVTAEKKEQFLAAIRQGCTVSVASRALNIDPRSFYRHKVDEPDFAEDWNAAYKEGTELLEEEARRRAAEGWDEPVFYQGEIVGYVRKYDSTLLMFTLKARDRDRYSDKSETKISGGLTLGQLIDQSYKGEDGQDV